MSIFIKLRTQLLILVLVLASVAVIFNQTADAAGLTHTSLLEIGGASNANPMIEGAGQQLVVDFTAATSTTPSSITLNFNNFSGGSVNATQTYTTTRCTTYFPSASTLPGGSVTAAGSGNIITLSTLGAETSGTNYCFILSSTSAVTNPATPGVYSDLLTVGSDTQNQSFDVLSSGANAYSVSATVPASFTLSLSGSTDALGTLSATALTVSTGVTATINTNAVSGWYLWAEDSNAGLHSAAQSHTIASVSTGSNHTMNGGAIGTEAYALGVTTDNTANYAYGGGTTGGGLSSTAFNEIASSGSSASNVTTVLHELADITGATAPSTDYTDTITVIGAGSF